MAKNLSEERETLYQMICSLKSEDIQKVVAYVSFLLFLEVHKDRDMAELLKLKPDEPLVLDEKAAPVVQLQENRSADPLPLNASPHETFLYAELVSEPSEPSEPAKPAAETSILKRPPEQRLRWVAKTLRLNYADMAFLFNVSPTMVRMWFAGAPLGAEEEMQLHYIIEIAKRVEEMDVPRLDQVLRQPMPDGELFLEKLKDRITDDNLNTLRETAERTEELRRKFKGATKPFHVMQSAIGQYATFLYCEG